MSSAQNGAGRTAEIIRTRERIGTGVLAFEVSLQLADARGHAALRFFKLFQLGHHLLLVLAADGLDFAVEAANSLTEAV